jgi:tetratricopeptide (TPR) repeat protein
LTFDRLGGVIPPNGSKDCDETIAGTMKNAWRSLAAVCALVIGVYAYMAQSGLSELLTPNAADAYYNLLVQGFRTGQLSLRKEVPSGLAQLADPYDPAANVLYWAPPYLMNDLSYYKGRLYLYFGITPALILFWPVVTLTGHYLFHRQAVTIFCAIGFLVSVGLLRALWRRYFAEVSIAVVAACALALGLATGVPMLLSRANVYEVSISCGYMLTMLSLGAIWCALHEPERRCRWLAAASVAYGLAVGARPSLLFGAVILLVPVIQARRERRQIWDLLMAATGPIVLIGLGLMLYNAQRFDSPFEFGCRYQLVSCEVGKMRQFSLHYLWFNFRVYFLEPARWSTRFPFVHDIVVPPMPPGYARVETPFGVLTSIPLVWLALAAPLVWRRRSAEAASILRWFVMAAALLFGICALTIGVFFAACIRYEVDFLPALLLLAVVGILGLERVLADRAVWRHAVRWGYVLLLGFSVAFNLLASVENYAKAHNILGFRLAQVGRVQEAIIQFEQALRLKPDYAEVHNNLGSVLRQAGKLEEAIEQYKQALRIEPDYADAHNNLGITLARLGSLPEAMGHWEEALRLQPDFAEAHNNLGIALAQVGRVQEAIIQFQQALRIEPDYPEAHYNLGMAFAKLGRMQEAMEHWEQALRIKPDFAEPHYFLGNVLLQQGRRQEAMEQYEQALRIKPDFTEARNALARLQARQ